MQNSTQSNLSEPFSANHWVVFDFDKTLTYRDTVFGFFWHAAKPGLGKYFRLVAYWCMIILAKLGFVRLNNVKNLGIRWFLGHHNRSSLDNVARAYARKIDLNRVYYGEFKEKHPQALIVSASLESYLVHLFSPERVIAATLEFDRNGHPLRILEDCQGVEKVRRLKKTGIDHITKLYTDSSSDAPLGEISDEIYLVKGDSCLKVDSL